MPRIDLTYLNSSGENVDLEFIGLLGPSPLHLHPNLTLLFLAKKTSQPRKQPSCQACGPRVLWQSTVHLLREAIWQEHHLQL